MLHIILKASYIDITICERLGSLTAELIVSEFANIESSTEKLVRTLAISFVIPHLAYIQVAIRIPASAIPSLFPVLITLSNPEHSRFHSKDCDV